MTSIVTRTRIHTAYHLPRPGHKVVIPTPELPGTAAVVTTHNGRYFAVRVAPLAGLFQPGHQLPGIAAGVWRHPGTGEWVADFWRGQWTVEADRTHTPLAALCSAVDAASAEGRKQGLW